MPPRTVPYRRAHMPCRPELRRTLAFLELRFGAGTSYALSVGCCVRVFVHDASLSFGFGFALGHAHDIRCGRSGSLGSTISSTPMHRCQWILELRWSTPLDAECSRTTRACGPPHFRRWSWGAFASGKAPGMCAPGVLWYGLCVCCAYGVFHAHKDDDSPRRHVGWSECRS